MNESETKFISLAEASKLTEYSQDYLGLLCRQGKLKGQKLGRNWVTTKEWVFGYVEKINNKSKDAIPVKIIKTPETNKLDKEDKTENKKPETKEKINLGYPSIKKLFSTERLMLATLAISFLVSGLVFWQQGVIGKYGTPVVNQVASVVRGWSSDGRSEVSKNLNREIFALNDSVNLIKNESVKVADNFRSDKRVSTEFVNFSNSLDLIKNESTGFASGKIITFSDSLNFVKNETIKFADYKIATVNNSLNIIKNEVNKKSANKIAEVLKSQNDLRNLELAPVTDSVTPKFYSKVQHLEKAISRGTLHKELNN